MIKLRNKTVEIACDLDGLVISNIEDSKLIHGS